MTVLRNLSIAGKAAVALIVAMVLGLASGNQTGSSIAAFAFLILIILGVWWVFASVLRLLDRKSRRVSATNQPNKLVDGISSSESPAPPPMAWPPPLNQSVHVPRIGDVLALTPGQFELLTAALLESIGYREVQRTGKAGDLGADITCRDHQGRTAIVQCKRYAPGSTIGTPLVQTFIGMMAVHHRAQRGLIIATVPFTPPAVDLARQHGIALIDGPALLLLLHLTGIPLSQQPESPRGIY